MQIPSDEALTRGPSTRPHYELWGRHELDMEMQRNILLCYINQKGLDEECLQFIQQVKRSMGIEVEGDPQRAEGDTPFCDSCGYITVRNGSCYRCPNCGNSMEESK